MSRLPSPVLHSEEQSSPERLRRVFDETRGDGKRIRCTIEQEEENSNIGFGVHYIWELVEEIVKFHGANLQQTITVSFSGGHTIAYQHYRGVFSGRIRTDG